MHGIAARALEASALCAAHLRESRPILGAVRLEFVFGRAREVYVCGLDVDTDG
ncbi:MAG TPA: hypothetical protein PKE31_08870 [Pseudomonadota bacterium]|nr:hypothetical protein [Pseudomonadota bacterium]